MLEALKQALLIAARYLGLLQEKKNEEVIKPVDIPPFPNEIPEVPKYLWDTPEHVRHSIRVICDEAGLSPQWKNVITACIYQESQFFPGSIGKKNSNGTIDYGLCQYNNGKNKQGVPYWIGRGAVFASTEEVLNNPEKNVRVMIQQFKKGNLHLWASFSTDAYLVWMQKVQTPVPLSGHY